MAESSNIREKYDIYNCYFNSNRNEAVLNTSSSQIIGMHTVEHSLDNGFNIVAPSSQIYVNASSNTNGSISPTEHSFKQLAELLQDLYRRLEQKVGIIEASQLSESNPLTHSGNQQHIQSVSQENMDEPILSVDETLGNHLSQQTSSTAVTRNTNDESVLTNNIDSDLTSLPSGSNSTSMSSNQIPLGSAIINCSNSSHRSLDHSNEESKAKVDRAQSCLEVTPRVREPTSLDLAVLDPGETDKERQPEPRKQSKRKRKPSIPSEKIIEVCCSQVSIANFNPIKSDQAELYSMALLHPLKQNITGKADRTEKLLDVLDRDPVLYLWGINLSNFNRMEMVMVSESCKGKFFSIYQPAYNKGNHDDMLSFPIKLCHDQPNLLRLENVSMRKRPDYDMKNQVSVSRMQSEKTYILKSYPSGEPVNTKISAQQEFNKTYNLTRIQPVFRLVPESLQTQQPFEFYANLLYRLSKSEEIDCKLNVTMLNFSGSDVPFNDNRHQIILSIEIPEMFHCTIKTGFKWLRVSITIDDKIHPFYSIDFGDGDSKNPVYFNIRDKSFKIQLNIVPQALSHSQPETQKPSSNGCNFFKIKIQLVHSENYNDLSTLLFYKCCPAWRSELYTINTICLSSGEQLPILESQPTGQKRINDTVNDLCDYDLGLPVVKAPRIH
ncbi:unnamed protein product [Rotaria socialis]|uniref:Uncharacterized protein n=1 Tax=Rotaria socialis TaxID=392032 RepID=A0A817VJK6_9BILA|nr:unnamed protein product [Rotaria socialis]